MSPVKKSPTIYDVAKKSGVSISTISRVLNSPDKVNAETRKKVMEAIDTLMFVPKAEARARALQGMGRIGVLTPFFTAPSFVQRLRGLASSLSKSNYELVIYPVDSMDQLHGYLSSIPVMGNLDGLIIMSLYVGEKEAQRLSQSGMETVLIEYPNAKLNSIIINDQHGGRLIAEHFIKKGHKRFAFFGDIEPPERNEIHPVRSRLNGFKQAIKDAGLHLPEKNIFSAPYVEERTQKTAIELLGLPEPPTAVFAASDTQALTLIKEARQRGIKVPSDLAVAGFDDIDMAEYMDLTTIRQHLDDSGKLAAEIILSRINDSSRPLQHINLPLNLIERMTT